MRDMFLAIAGAAAIVLALYGSILYMAIGPAGPEAIISAISATYP
jgi:hypothetical protein